MINPNGEIYKEIPINLWESFLMRISTHSIRSMFDTYMSPYQVISALNLEELKYLRQASIINISLDKRISEDLLLLSKEDREIFLSKTREDWIKHISKLGYYVSSVEKYGKPDWKKFNSIYSLIILKRFKVDYIQCILFIRNRQNKFYTFSKYKIGKKKREIIAPDSNFIKDCKKILHFLYRCKKFANYKIIHKNKESIKNKLLSFVGRYGYLNQDSILIKYDIKSAFSSIKFENFVKASKVMQDKFFKELIKCLFYEDKLPQGFSTSPLLFQIYIKDIDSIAKPYIKCIYLKSNAKYIINYLRYIDDFFIILTSLGSLDKNEMLKDFETSFQATMPKGIVINKKKTKIIYNGKYGNIKVLGHCVYHNRIQSLPKLTKKLRNKIRMYNYQASKFNNIQSAGIAKSIQNFACKS